MLQRFHNYFVPRTDPAPAASEQIQRDGHAILRAVLTAAEIAALIDEIDEVYASHPIDTDGDHMTTDEKNDFRHGMLNKSALCQATIGHPSILATIEPLLGEDCHVIANTCWRNPPREKHRTGGGWHIDAGPHIPRPADQVWPDHIPYPVFAIGVHIFLRDCPLACGPTGVIPGSQKSGSPPPLDRPFDGELTYNGQGTVALTAKAGDVAFFGSDVWHRRLPTTAEDQGRLFLQAHYARRDIAQRIEPTRVINHLSEEAIARAETPRQRQLVGLHARGFYDG